VSFLANRETRFIQKTGFLVLRPPLVGGDSIDVINGVMRVTQAVAIVLAAGQGTRMNSDLPKVVHKVCGRSMVEHVLVAVRQAGVKKTVVVVGHKADIVKQTLAGIDDVEFALQDQQLGTGHAVMMCEEALRDHDGPVLVLAGDTPLLKAESLGRLLEEQQGEGVACVIGTAETDANEGLGRIVRDAGGEFVAIVEHKDATPEQRSIREINTGCFAFDCRALFDALSRIEPRNKQGEFYLTDCPSIMKADGRRVIASCSLDINEAMGVNTPEQLAAVEEKLKRRSS
jgi:bifunctional UDP-N-acetylglucosamine pyrophosphorylase/glucosamine-1-phosphate N-acetyltransferase